MQDEPDAFAKTLDAVRLRYEEAINRHDDPAGFAALFAEDGILVPVGQPIVAGRAAIEAWARDAVKIWNRIAIMMEHVGGGGLMASSAGTWHANLNTPDGGTANVAGNYLTLLHQEDGAWLIKAHSWNIHPEHAPAARLARQMTA